MIITLTNTLQHVLDIKRILIAPTQEIQSRVGGMTNTHMDAVNKILKNQQIVILEERTV
jgi:hypothetical protein